MIVKKKRKKLKSKLAVIFLKWYLFSDKSVKSKKKDDLNASASKIDLDVDLKSNMDIPAKADEHAIADVIGGGNMNTLPGRSAAGSILRPDAMGTINADAERKKVCMLHKQPLRYFCDSCEELICYDCTVMGPHNTQLHRISSIDDSFRFRFDQINKHIHSSLVPKRA